MSFSLLVAHYGVNGLFLDEEKIFSHLEKITDIDYVLTQGKLDISSPIKIDLLVFKYEPLYLTLQNQILSHLIR